ncbi:MAG: shikimate kinase [Schleiferiaceae bacterium]|nr:shikimate kinase [Schleiferiaceae bacterium]MDR9441607.1 shikimate kinase [Schleiferiaceae bacterium]
MKISLLGYMGAGKSTLGKALAQRWSLPFLDLDEVFQAQMGLSVAETLRQKGEIYFRRAEHQLLEELLSRPRFVLALGGGTPCYYQHMEELNAHTHTVYLQQSVKQLAERLRHQRAERPLLAEIAEEQLSEFIAKHLFERRAFYERAQLTLPQSASDTEAQIDYLEKHLL